MIYKNKDITFLSNVSADNTSAQMQLFGVIGDQIDGNKFANELLVMSTLGFDSVTININSVGGSIIEGFSILNAMNTLRLSGTAVATYGLGVMDSMAGIILAFGDRGRRTATNFSSGVIHEPIMTDENSNQVTIDEMPEGKAKDEMVFMRECLLTSMSVSTGMPYDKLLNVMKESKRRTAKELLSFGIIDKITEASNIVETQNMSRIRAMAACTKAFKSKKITMKKENNKEDMSAIEKEITKKDALISELQNSVKQMKEELDVLKKEKADAEKVAAETYVDQQIESGKFSKDKREVLVNKATSDFDSFKSICDSLNNQFVDVTTKLENSSSKDEEGDTKMLALAKEYHKHDVQGTLNKFKNKVGEKKYNQAEDYYSENINKVI